MIEVLQPGLLTTIQDRGRRGYEAYGVQTSGFFDPFLASVANQLVGNLPHQPVLEFALVGPTLRCLEDCWVGITGFSVEYLVEGNLVPEYNAFLARAGSILEFSGMKGWFGYLSVGGSFRGEETLGSSSTYLAGRMGRKLQRGSRLECGKPGGKYVSIRKEMLELRTTNIVNVLPALHTDSFAEREQQKLVEHEYAISMRSNRMGIHLDGVGIAAPAVQRSVPVLPGTIQVPQSGQPIILGPEGPTTGGYAQIAILSRLSWTKLAEIRPGQQIRFQWSTIAEARRMWNFRQRIFETPEAWLEVKS